MAAGPPFGVVKSFGSVEVKLLLRATSWQAVELGRVSRLSERSRVPLGTRFRRCLALSAQERAKGRNR